MTKGEKLYTCEIKIFWHWSKCFTIYSQHKTFNSVSHQTWIFIGHVRDTDTIVRPRYWSQRHNFSSLQPPPTPEYHEI